MNLGSSIKNIRKKKKLNQEELAKSVGITQAYLSQLENNKKDANLATLKQLSIVLDVPLPIIFYLALDKEDIQEGKREAFEVLRVPIEGMVRTFFI